MDRNLELLIRELPEFKKINFKLTPLIGDASTRRYIRLEPEQPGAASLIVMDLGTEADLPARPEDYPFVNIGRFLKQYDVAVPEIYHYLPAAGLILLEDLGDLAMEEHVTKNPEAYPELYRLAIDELIKIQYSTLAAPRSASLAISRSFYAEFFLQELEFFLQHTVEGYLKRNIAEGDRNRLKDFFYEVCKKITDEPKVLNHRDYHSRNLMWQAGRLRVIDFQDARLGPCQYDLASLLKDSYARPADELAREMEEYYLKRREAFVGAQDQEHFHHIYLLTVLQRSLKAAGTFGFQALRRGNPRYLKNLAPVLNYAYVAAEELPEARPYLELFDRYWGEARWTQ